MALPPTLMEPARGFSESEYAQRVQRAQAAMNANGLDILLLMTEADVRYFSGFHTPFWQSPTRPWFLLVPQSGKPVAVIPSIGCWSSPHPHDDGFSLLAKTLRELAGNAPAVGIPVGRETQLRMPLQDYERLKGELNKASWHDASQLVQRLRMVKSVAEIDKIRHVCQLVSSVYADTPQFLSPGMTLISAFNRFKIACLEAGVDDPAYLVGGAGIGGYSDIISPPSSRELQPGDVLILDTGCVWDGYFCDFDRNFAIGKADPKASVAHQIVWDATEAGLAQARAGVSVATLFQAMHEVMQPHAVEGDGDVGRLGHGLGMQLTEPPSLTPFEQTILEAGMVITLEPGYQFAPNKMMVHEENILITEDGAELLSQRAAQQMPVIA